MENFLSVLLHTPLFDQIDAEQAGALLQCLGSAVTHLEKNEYAMMAGDVPDFIGVVLQGQLQISREDDLGNRRLLSLLEPGDFYAETLACAQVPYSPVHVIAVTGATVIKLAFGRILTTCPQTCGFHTQLVRNMMGILARKNLTLQGRMELLEKKSIRERLLAYLRQTADEGSRIVEVPFNRNELADYLAVDRSALSREIGRLQKEGFFHYHKRKFEIL